MDLQPLRIILQFLFSHVHTFLSRVYPFFIIKIFGIVYKRELFIRATSLGYRVAERLTAWRTIYRAAMLQKCT